MIPKKIHYCWFGGNELPELALRCIASWKKFLPEYEIVEWNESNFNVNCCQYVKEAYEAKKWAFVSDYARLYILYQEGGLYFDTDVELIASIDDIVARGAFMGVENEVDNSTNPGLGLAAAPGLGLYKEILEFYHGQRFFKEDGTLNLTTIVRYTTDILKTHGFTNEREVQCVQGVYIYPKDYFCPMDYQTGVLKCTKNTRSIHHYSASWLSTSQRRVNCIKRPFKRIVGESNFKKIKNFAKRYKRAKRN